MTKTEQIAQGFALLREQCDPRGHDLLLALENLCLVESIAIDMLAVGQATPSPEADALSNVVFLTDRYSMKI